MTVVYRICVDDGEYLSILRRKKGSGARYDTSHYHVGVVAEVRQCLRDIKSILYLPVNHNRVTPYLQRPKTIFYTFDSLSDGASEEWTLANM